MLAEDIPCREKSSILTLFKKTQDIFSSYALPFLYFIFLFSIPLKNAVYQVSLMLINLSFLVMLFRNRDFRVFFLPCKELCIAMGLIALSMGLSNFFGVSGKLGWEGMLKHILRFFLFFFATLYFFHHKKLSFSFIVYSLFLVFFTHAFYGLGEYCWGSTSDKFGNRLSGLTYNPNQYGFIMALSVVFSFATGIQIKKINPQISYRICRFLLLLLWLFSCWCLLQSGSRGSWLGAAVGMILVAFLVPRYLKQKTSWIFAFVFIGVLFFLFKIDMTFQERMNALVTGDSSYRIEIWQDVLHYIMKKPFLGYGVDAYQALERVMPEIYSAHSIVLSIFMELGILGFFAWFYFFFICVMRLVFLKYRQPSTFVFAGLLAVFFVSGQFDHSLTTDKIYLSCLYFSLALIFAVKAGEGYFQYQLLTNKTPLTDSVLLIEPNNNHGEVILGYVEYFVNFGFFVDVVVTPAQMENKPFALSKLQNVNFYAIDEVFLPSLLSRKETLQYSLIFFTTAEMDGITVSYYLSRKIYLKTFAVLHYRKQLLDKAINRLYKDKRLLVLRNFLEDPLLFEVNPHTFGQVRPGSRNKKTRFICVGAFKSERRNTALLIEAVERMLLSGVRDFSIVVITRKKPEDKIIPTSIASFFDLKVGLDYESMFHEIEKADFFLPLLDPSIPSQKEYLSELSTGSIQLIIGFLCPALIEYSFALAYGLDESNSVLYEGSNLEVAMHKAMQISADDYFKMQQNLKILSDKKKRNGMENLRQLLLEHSIVPPINYSKKKNI